MRKRIFVLLFLLPFCCLLTSCFAGLPYDQINSKWQTDDGSVVLYVVSNNRIYGKINTDTHTEFVELYGTRDIVYIQTLFYFDGQDGRMYWDKIQRHPSNRDAVDCVSEKYSIKRRLCSPDRIEFSGFEQSNLGLERNFTVKCVGKNLTSEEIEYPPIKLPEYYYLYEKYKDALDGELKTLSEFEAKYGKCDVISYHEVTMDGETQFVTDNYYYVADVDEQNRPTYYIEMNSINDRIYPSLICAEMLPAKTMDLNEQKYEEKLCWR